VCIPRIVFLCHVLASLVSCLFVSFGHEDRSSWTSFEHKQRQSPVAEQIQQFGGRKEHLYYRDDNLWVKLQVQLTKRVDSEYSTEV
jgi:hypothetical protein